MKPHKTHLSYLAVIMVVSLLSSFVCAQNSNRADEITELRSMVAELRTELKQTQANLARAQQQIQKLDRAMNSLNTTAPADTEKREDYISGADTSADALKSAPQRMADAEDPAVLRAQVDEQQQTKVESASKYRVKLSGLILMNAFSNRGAVDLQDIPGRAFNSQDPGAIGATLRQTILGLQVIGPELAGARTSGSVNVDFAGGFPVRPYGLTYGLLRLREAKFNLDWKNDSLMVGQETPAISPLSPTSYATVAEPAFSWSGNLWAWTPQVIFSHRVHTSDQSYFSFGGGLALPMTEDQPVNSQFNIPGPGELSRRPAFEAVAEWRSTMNGEPLRIGLGGYSSRLKYEFGRNVNAWAGTAFWEVPFGRYLQWSGEAFRGEGLGGLGGGIWQTEVFNGNPTSPSSILRPLNTVGGWTQLKVKAMPKLEFNVAGGQDNVLAFDLRWAPQLIGEYDTVFARNRAALVNTIYRPKSNLLFSVEYRKIWTYQYTGVGNRADQVNVAAGVSF
jgi:hypothetical protein